MLKKFILVAGLVTVLATPNAQEANARQITFSYGCDYATDKNCPHSNNRYTYGRQDKYWLYLTINNSVPSECQYPAYAARETWNSLNAGFQYVWNGYTTAVSRQVSGGTLIATSANKLDSADIAVGDVSAGYAEAQTRYEWKNHESSSDPARTRYTITDGDVMIKPAAMAISYCGTGTVPSDKISFQNMIAHELGHGAGLAHKLQDQVGADVMYGYQRKGPAPITASTNDRNSMFWLY